MVDRVREFAQDIGGDLFGPSDEQESISVYSWLTEAQRSVDANHASKDELSEALGIDCDEWLSACYEFNGYWTVIGVEYSDEAGA